MSFELPEKLKKVVLSLSKLPGIGEKSALRHTLALAKWSSVEILEFSRNIEQIDDLNYCQECGAYSDSEICNVCQDPQRQGSKVLCVIESVADAFAIEKSGAFQGLYHILGGVLNPLMNITPENLTIDKLLSRIKERGIEEVVLALNPSVEGDITSSYIRDMIPDFVKVKKLGIGMPMGGSLEYLDALTINKAIEYGKYY